MPPHHVELLSVGTLGASHRLSLPLAIAQGTGNVFAVLTQRKTPRDSAGCSLEVARASVAQPQPRPHFIAPTTGGQKLEARHGPHVRDQATGNHGHEPAQQRQSR